MSDAEATVVEELAPAPGEGTAEAEQEIVPTDADALEDSGEEAGDQSQPLSKREARKALREDRERAARARREEEAPVESAEEIEPSAATEAGEEEVGEEVKVDEHGRKHDPKTGHYLPKEGDESGEGEEVAEGEEAEEPAAATFDVPIPGDHPVAGGGVGEIKTADEKSAEAVRALLNGTYTRRQEVEEVRGLLGEREKQVMELRRTITQMEARSVAQEKFRESPTYKMHQERYHEIQESVGQEAASAYWQSPAVQNDIRKIESEEFDSRWGDVEAELEQQAGEMWVRDTMRIAKETLPPYVTSLEGFQKVFDGTVDTLEAEIQAGRHGELDADQARKHFFEMLRLNLVRDPTIRNVLRAQTEAKDKAEAEKKRKAAEERDRIERAKKEGAEEAKKRAAETRRATPPSPLGALSDADRGTHGVIKDTPEDEEERLAAANPRQLRRELKSAARGDARRRFGQR